MSPAAAPRQSTSPKVGSLVFVKSRGLGAVTAVQVHNRSLIPPPLHIPPPCNPHHRKGYITTGDIFSNFGPNLYPFPKIMYAKILYVNTPAAATSNGQSRIKGAAALNLPLSLFPPHNQCETPSASFYSKHRIINLEKGEPESSHHTSNNVRPRTP